MRGSERKGRGRGTRRGRGTKSEEKKRRRRQGCDHTNRILGLNLVPIRGLRFGFIRLALGVVLRSRIGLIGRGGERKP